MRRGLQLRPADKQQLARHARIGSGRRQHRQWRGYRRHGLQHPRVAGAGAWQMRRLRVRCNRCHVLGRGPGAAAAVPEVHRPAGECTSRPDHQPQSRQRGRMRHHLCRSGARCHRAWRAGGGFCRQRRQAGWQPRQLRRRAGRGGPAACRHQGGLQQSGSGSRHRSAGRQLREHRPTEPACSR